MKKGISNTSLRRIASRIGQGVLFPEGIGEMDGVLESGFREALTKAILSVISGDPSYATYTDDSLPFIAEHYVNELMPVLKEMYYEEEMEMAKAEYSAWAD